MEEKWKCINNCSDYQISTHGRVLNRNTKQFLSGSNANGYIIVSLKTDEGERKSFLVHRLVAEAFLEDWNVDLTVNHIDGNRDCNIVSNLEMITRVDNIKKSSNSKGVNQYTLDGKFIRSFNSCSEAEKFLLGETTNGSRGVSACAKGFLKQALGFKWEYVNPIYKTEARITKSNGKKTIQLDKDNNQLAIFDSLHKAAESVYNNRISDASIASIVSAISSVCLGKRKTAYGFRWKYFE